MALNPSIKDPYFERAVTLREAYLIMLRFVTDYCGRGDTTCSDFLYVYSSLRANGTGETLDPAAIGDFIKAATAVLDQGESS